jgi:hypothetical protein
MLLDPDPGPGQPNQCGSGSTNTAFLAWWRAMECSSPSSWLSFSRLYAHLRAIRFSSINNPSPLNTVNCCFLSDYFCFLDINFSSVSPYHLRKLFCSLPALFSFNLMCHIRNIALWGPKVPNYSLIRPIPDPL